MEGHADHECRVRNDGIQNLLKKLDSGWSLPRTGYGAGMTVLMVDDERSENE